MNSLCDMILVGKRHSHGYVAILLSDGEIVEHSAATNGTSVEKIIDGDTESLSSLYCSDSVSPAYMILYYIV